MNRKLYIKWLLQQWLPLIFIFGAIMLLAYFVPSLSGAIYPYQTAEEYFGYSSYDFTQTLFYTEIGEINAGTTAIMNCGIVAAIAMPFFVFSYRFDKSSADAYLQVPAKRNEIRLIRVFVGLAIILSALTIVFWGGNIAKVIRQASFAKAREGAAPFYFFNYGYYALFYLYLILIVASTYLFNCTLLHIVGRVLDGLILFGVVAILMAGALCFFLGYYTVIYSCVVKKFETPIVFSPYDGLSAFANPSMVCTYVFEPLICYSTIDKFEVSNITIGTWYAYPIVKLALSSLLFICHEPSGEYFGKPGGINKIGKIIIHVLGAMCALTTGIAWFYISWLGVYVFFLMVFIYGLFALSYYLLIALYQKSFSLKKDDLIIYLSVLAAGIIASIVFGCIGNSIYGAMWDYPQPAASVAAILL